MRHTGPGARPSASAAMVPIRSVTQFLGDAIDGFKNTDFPAAIAAAVPWAGLVGEVVSEAVPPVRFLIKLYDGWAKEHEPLVLGYYACTLAYQRAVEEAVLAVGRPDQARVVPGEVRAELKSKEISHLDLSGFSLSDALEHPFIQAADAAFLCAVRGAGYSDIQLTQLSAKVHERFVPVLKDVLSHGKTVDRFKPFTDLMQLGTRERHAYEALSAHAARQRWLYERRPLFEREPFALAHVYIDSECGRLTWGELRNRRPAPDAFSESCGGRHPLLETVLDQMADPDFRDAIVIQGAAGTGKSAFTLRLCAELLDQGLRPIRVRLRDLRFDVHVREALPQAVHVPLASRPDDVFLGGGIFKGTVPFRGADICPYVLILDGWDEISISVNKDFRDRVARMLEQVRAEYLSPHGPPIRVILTGRPSADVTESNFLREKTPILTLRPLRPEHLRRFVKDLGTALDQRPLGAQGPESDRWRIDDPARLEPALALYEREFKANARAKAPAKNGPIRRRRAPASPPSSGMEVLGSPLLAHLAIRLMAGWKDETADLVATSTTLYRSLVELTVKNAGKSPYGDDSNDGLARISGEELRSLLRRTAAAMTVLFQENLSDRELSLRLGLAHTDELDGHVSKATRDNVLSELMISFYFKGGRAGYGCEFLHKSFREYLFAEEVIEALKWYGRARLEATVNGHAETLEERAPHWKDFSRQDPRHAFSRTLGRLLGPQWLTRDVASHLRELIAWEIRRSTAASADHEANEAHEAHEARAPDGTTEPLELAGWEHVRDGLADLWDWWGEGVHLRPQRPDHARPSDPPSLFVADLIHWTMPMDEAQRLHDFEPRRTVTIDAHLGDALFRLAAVTHFELAQRTGWLKTRGDFWLHVSPLGEGPRRCQSSVQRKSGAWTLFSPSGADARFFANYIHRINAAGWRPEGPFPRGVSLRGVDLRRTTRYISTLELTDDVTAIEYANLSEAALEED